MGSNFTGNVNQRAQGLIGFGVGFFVANAGHTEERVNHHKYGPPLTHEVAHRIQSFAGAAAA